jgi:hypothetical protein
MWQVGTHGNTQETIPEALWDMRHCRLNRATPQNKRR